jgi:hypothetical protein
MQNVHTEKNLKSSSGAVANQNVGRIGISMPTVPVLQSKNDVAQKLANEEEEPLQMKTGPAQLRGVREDKLQMKPFQLKSDTVQRQAPGDEEEPLQGKLIIQQKRSGEKEVHLKPFQLRSDVTQRKEPGEEKPLQGKFIPVQKKVNTTGLPDNLKSGVESLSGIDISDVKVHYNSDRPAQLHALAYAQGTDIQVGPGQEKHLPHEAWHVVQQKQGRVQPTMQMKEGLAVNDDKGLEAEADMMGAKVMNEFKIQVASPTAQMKQRALETLTRQNIKTNVYQLGTRQSGLSMVGDDIEEFNSACDKAFILHINDVLPKNGNNLSVYAGGSFGRQEAIKGSDLDYFVVGHDGTEETREAINIMKQQSKLEIAVNHKWADKGRMQLELEETPPQDANTLHDKKGGVVAGRLLYSSPNSEAPVILVQKCSRKGVLVILGDIELGVSGGGNQKALFQAIAKLAIAIGQAKGYKTINPFEILKAAGLNEDCLDTYNELLMGERSQEKKPNTTKGKTALCERLKELAFDAYPDRN